MTAGEKTRPVVLTIAGFDPSGGAGTIADVRTIEAFGCTAVAAITSVTLQNAEKFFGAIHQPAESLSAQVEAVLDAFTIAGVKIGMLPTPEIVVEAVRLIRENHLPAPIVDPVLKSTTGAELMSEEAFEAFVTELLPLARVVTPNIPEAEMLAGMNIDDEEASRQAAGRIRELGARAVLIKGGHLMRESGIGSEGSGEDNREVSDLLDDDGEVRVFRGQWIRARTVRGTGCMLSSAVAAGLAQGSNLVDAVAKAKAFVADLIRASKPKTAD